MKQITTTAAALTTILRRISHQPRSIIIATVALVIILLAAFTLIQHRAAVSAAGGSDTAVQASNAATPASDSASSQSTLGTATGAGKGQAAAGESRCYYEANGTIICTTDPLNRPEAPAPGDGTNPTNPTTPPEPELATMQNFTAAQCDALDTYTGTNADAIISLADTRGPTTQYYEVAKLADGNCWMLTNLKLGSTSGSITLTPADSNVASNFTLPQLTTGGTADYDNPRAYGPVPGDTGSGATNYGYLYNFPAATAGETRTTFTSGNAQYSICPANWRLPTSGSPSSDLWQLDVAFGGTGAGGPSVAKWQPSGPFKGSFSGRWYGGFGFQGDAGTLWSASASPDHPDYAFFASFDPSDFYPGDGYDNRNFGAGVRCLLN